MASDVHANDLELLSQSGKWQVRYGVATKIRVSDTNARAILERLALDPDRRVARQAFAVYSSRFVDVEESPRVEWGQGERCYILTLR